MISIDPLYFCNKDCSLYPGFLAFEETETIMTRLIVETPWQEETIRLFGKTYYQPRLIAWYGDAGKNYTYSGKRYTPLTWTPLLLHIKNVIENHTQEVFNSVLVNYYRNGQDSMGFHRDNEPELGAQPVIASISLGATRTFVIKHRQDKSIKPIRIALKDGDLLIMHGLAQQDWLHGLPKTRKPCGPRINLTFRHIYA